MNEILLMLVLAYVALTALLLLAIISGRLHWLAKLVLLLVAFAFYWVSYEGWRQAQGWPTQADIPKKWLFHYAVVEEPREQEGFAGAIFVWLTDLENNEMAAEPRAYKLPYDQRTHIDIQLALKEIRHGNIQLGQRSDRPDDPADAEEKAAFGSLKYQLEFSDLPDPALPEK
jgi:Ca2+/Na+ antiporter